MNTTHGNLSYDNCMDRNQAMKIVAHVAGKKDYDKANIMLGIIERAIKEDKKNLVTTNMVRFLNEEEKKLFTEEDF